MLSSSRATATLGVVQDLPQTRATYADVLAASPDLIAEVIGGRLVTQPRPAPRHVLSTSALGGILMPPFQLGGVRGPGGWWVLDEPELHLGDDITVPDLAGWRRERMPKLPETAWFSLAPDWVCEAISPSTERYNRAEKRDIYATRGVGHLWLVDPANRLLETFELSKGRWTLLRTCRDNEQVEAPPFAVAGFDLGLLWAD